LYTLEFNVFKNTQPLEQIDYNVFCQAVKDMLFTNVHVFF
jgi:hypothetical protein